MVPETEDERVAIALTSVRCDRLFLGEDVVTPEVDVHLEWMDKPGVHVSEEAGRLSVHACPSLSAAQVRAACAELNEYGDIVYEGWQRAVGVNSEAEEAF